MECGRRLVVRVIHPAPEPRGGVRTAHEDFTGHVSRQDVAAQPGYSPTFLRGVPSQV